MHFAVDNAYQRVTLTDPRRIGHDAAILIIVMRLRPDCIDLICPQEA